MNLMMMKTFSPLLIGVTIVTELHPAHPEVADQSFSPLLIGVTIVTKNVLGMQLSLTNLSVPY